MKITLYMLWSVLGVVLAVSLFRIHPPVFLWFVIYGWGFVGGGWAFCSGMEEQRNKNLSKRRLR